MKVGIEVDKKENDEEETTNHQGGDVVDSHGVDADMLQPWIETIRTIVLNPPYDEPDFLPVQIFSWLYLSDAYNSVCQISKLQELGISHVITTNGMPSSELHRIKVKLEKFGIIHYAIQNARDKEGYEMLPLHWDEVKQFMEQIKKEKKIIEERRQGQEGEGQEEERNEKHTSASASTSTSSNNNDIKVVVHCLAGTNRSGVIVAAMMLILGENYFNDGRSTSSVENGTTTTTSTKTQNEKDDGPSATNTNANTTNTTNTTTLIPVIRKLKQLRGIVLTNESFQEQLCELAYKEGKLGTKPLTTVDDDANIGTNDEDDDDADDANDDITNTKNDNSSSIKQSTSTTNSSKSRPSSSSSSLSGQAAMDRFWS